eukprot:PhM_4_TR2588/c0_g2_i1/m.59467
MICVKHSKKIRFGGTTNMCGGVTAALDTIRGVNVEDESRKYDSRSLTPITKLLPSVLALPERVCGANSSVIAMVDGILNTGITQHDDVVELLRSRIEKYLPSCTIHVIGLGNDLDSLVLRRMANVGEGSFYYVNKEEDLMWAYADCLAGIRSSVVQDVAVKVRPEMLGSETGVTNVQMYSTKLMSDDEEDAGRRTKAQAAHSLLRFRNISEDEERSFLVDVTYSGTVSNNIEALPLLALEYSTPRTSDEGRLVTNQNIEFSVPSVVEGDDVLATTCDEVSAERIRQAAVRALDEAAWHMSMYDPAYAERTIRWFRITKLDDDVKTAKDGIDSKTHKMKAYFSTLFRYLEEQEDRHLYQSVLHQEREQRSARVSRFDDDFEAKKKYQPESMWGTRAKDEMNVKAQSHEKSWSPLEEI